MVAKIINYSYIISMNQNNSANNLIVYRLDNKDRISYVSPNWDNFVIENDGPDDLLSANVLNKTIWLFISDSETSQIYTAILEKVRKFRKSFKINIRCDAPSIVRYIDISINPLDNENVEFNCVTIRTQPRPPVFILDRKFPRTQELIKMCSYCKAIKVGNIWLDTEEAVVKLNLFSKEYLPAISHGICSSCYEKFMKELNDDNMAFTQPA